MSKESDVTPASSVTGPSSAAVDKTSVVGNSGTITGKDSRKFQFYVNNGQYLKVPLILHFSKDKSRWEPVVHLINNYIHVNDNENAVTITPNDLALIKEFLEKHLSDVTTRSPPSNAQSELDKRNVAINVKAFGEKKALKTAFFVEARNAIGLAHNAGIEEWRRYRERDDFGNFNEYMAWILNLVDPAEKDKRKRYHTSR